MAPSNFHFFKVLWSYGLILNASILFGHCVLLKLCLVLYIIIIMVQDIAALGFCIGKHTDRPICVKASMNCVRVLV